MRRRLGQGRGLLLVIALAGVGIRIAYDATIGHRLQLGLDSTWYQLMGNQLAGGAGYVDPATLISTGQHVATANFPPLYPAALAGFHLIGLTSRADQQFAGALLGGLSVVLTGLLGRQVGGWRIGLPAAALVAVWPPLIAGDGSLMSETLAVPATLAATLATLLAARKGGWARWVVAGSLLGALCLVRSELPLTVVFLLLFAVLFGQRDGPATFRRLAGATMALALAFAIVLPWSLSRHSAVGDEAFLPTNGAKTLAGANCPAAYGGKHLGGWTFTCVSSAVGPDPTSTENEQAARERHAGLHYMRQHLSRLPVVVASRELRLAGAWSPAALIDADILESRDATWDRLDWYCTIVALPFMLAGCVLLARRAPLILAPVAATVVAAAATYGSPRLRLPAEPMLLIATVVAVEAVVQWRRRAADEPASHRHEI